MVYLFFQKARCQLLKYFLSERDRNNVLNIDSMATQTEGFSIQDLYDLIIRIVFESFKRNQGILIYITYIIKN